VLSDQSVRAALFAFALTRAIVFVIFILVPHVQSLNPSSPAGEGRDVSISLDRLSPARTLRPLAGRGDGGWYIGIAEHGYEKIPFTSGHHNWAFFPLYPLTLRAAAAVTGGYALTGMALSSVFLLLALVILHKLCLSYGCDQATADRAVFYAAAFPTSYFYSLPQTESLFLLLTVGSFYAAVRERWTLAGVCGALASATRFVGVLMLPTLLLLYWQRRRTTLRASALGILLSPLGVPAYALYLRWITGNAFAFRDAHAAWGRGRTGLFITPLWEYLTHPSEVAPPTGGGNFNLLHVAAALTAFACGYKLLRRREWALSFYTLASIIIPLTTLSVMAATRYVMVIFPVYVVLGAAGQRPVLDQTIRSLLLVLFGIMTLLFAAYFNLAFT
ncbi:MAG TPA: mannosyltransferase family protein, partial [Pyrinomonadaceae bacterium]